METALLCASYGAVDPESQRAVAAVESALRQEVPQARFARAFTSDVLRRRLAAQGTPVESVPQALCRLAAEGCGEAVLQPTLLLPGTEYGKLQAQACEARGRFSRLRVGRPLLFSPEDATALAAALAAERLPRPGVALVFLGHGAEGPAQAAYGALQAAFRGLGRRDVFVATGPAQTGAPALAGELEAAGFPAARLAPLLLAPGTHARNNLAGPGPDSWYSRLSRAGLSLSWSPRGLGESRAVQALYRLRLKQLLET